MKQLVFVALSISLLAGCTTLKRATGQIDNTVLPGQRQEILAPGQQSARDPTVTGQVPPAAGAIAQTPINAPNGSPNQQANAAPLAMPNTSVCDPKVDLCPAPVQPDPLPPPSPVKLEKTAKDLKSVKSMKAADASKLAGSKTGIEKVGASAQASATTPDAATATPAKKVVKKKKKILKPKIESTVPATPDLTAPAVPAPDGGASAGPAVTAPPAVLDPPTPSAQ